ncbi:MAG: hypothetical protein ACKVKG_15270, partial [Alphaproteobacteria bacterium]
MWGGNSYYTDDGTADCFQAFFNPVSTATLDDFCDVDGLFFPSKWRPENLRQDGLNVWEGMHSRLSGLYFLNRPEPVAISDFFTQVLELVPWLSEGHWLHGADVMTVMRRLYVKYLTLNPAVQTEVDRFIDANFGEAPVLG